MKGINLLGLKVEDKITKATGIVTSISYDLYGCIQAIITLDAGTENRESLNQWYDIKRLKILDDTPVLDTPDWNVEEIGCECKPLM